MGLLVTTGVIVGFRRLLDVMVRVPALVLGAAAVGGAMTLLAVTNFEMFLLAALGIRAILDSFKAAGGLPAAASPAALLGALFLVASVLWLAAQRRDERPLTVSTTAWAMLLFVVAAVVSVFGSVAPAVSANEVLRLLAVVAMLVVLEQVARDPMWRRRALTAIFMAAVVPVIVGLGQIATGGGLLVGGVSRIRGTFLHSNPFAMFLTLLLVMGVAVAPALDRRARAWLGLLGVAGTVTLVATYTRGAWAAVVLGVLVVAWVQRRGLLAATVLLAVVGALFAPGVSDRLQDLAEDRTFNGRPANSWEWRLEYWEESISLAEDNPLFGVGFGMVSERTDIRKPPHNDLVRAYAEVGILGAASYLFLLVSLAVLARRALRRARSRLDRGIAAGVAGCVAAFVLLSAAANVITQVVVMWYLVAFLALGAAVAERPEEVPTR